LRSIGASKCPSSGCHVAHIRCPWPSSRVASSCDRRVSRCVGCEPVRFLAHVWQRGTGARRRGPWLSPPCAIATKVWAHTNEEGYQHVTRPLTYFGSDVQGRAHAG